LNYFELRNGKWRGQSSAACLDYLRGIIAEVCISPFAPQGSRLAAIDLPKAEIKPHQTLTS